MLQGREDAHDQVASSEQLTRFPSTPLFAWYFRTEKSPCMQIHKPGILYLLKTAAVSLNQFTREKEKKKAKS